MTAETKAEDKKPVLVLLDKDVIKSRQDKVRKDILSLDTEIHSIAVQCLMHADKFGDTSLMTRLLTEVLDEMTGYNRRGLIRWMREFSPMELIGKKINLSGVDGEGKRRPFMIEKANATPFYLSEALNQQSIKPIFQDTLLAKFDTMVREFEASWANTKMVGGKPVPIDSKKPYYDGINSAQILDFVEKGKTMRMAIKEDATRDVYLAKQELKKAELLVQADAEAPKETRVA